MGEHETWFFTFGCGQKHENMYVEVIAKNASKARGAMIEGYGNKFCGQYDEEFWNSDKNLNSNYGLLEVINAI